LNFSCQLSFPFITGPFDVQGILFHPISEKGGRGEEVVVVTMMMMTMMTGLYSGGTSFKYQPIISYPMVFCSFPQSFY
jgi:hypothetical protein